MGFHLIRSANAAAGTDQPPVNHSLHLFRSDPGSILADGRPVVWESVHPEKKRVSRCDNVGKDSTKLVKTCGFPAGRGTYSFRFQLDTTQRREQ